MNNITETKLEMRDPQLERKLIGEILLEPKIIDEVRVLLNVNVFTDEKCKAIYKMFLKIDDEGGEIDTVAVYMELSKAGLKELVTAADISTLLMYVNTAARAIDHCKILIEKWMQREVITKLTNGIELIKREGDVFEIISTLHENLYEIENNITIEKDRDLYSELPGLVDKVVKKLEGKIPEGLKSTSFPSLNKATGGIMSSDFIVIYGKEKAAKTTVTEQIGLDLAIQGIPISIFTLEMDFDSFAYKALSMECGIEYLKLRNPKGQGLTDKEFGEFTKRMHKFEKTKIFIDDRTFDFDQMIGKMKLLKRKYNIGLFIVDYLGLIESYRRFEARRLEIKHYSRRLKNLCKELNTPIIAVSQANENERTAESMDPLRDCDFALRCCKPKEDGIEGVKTDNNEYYNFTEDDFLVTVERSRHGKNKQNFVCGYVNNSFKEKDITQ